MKKYSFLSSAAIVVAVLFLTQCAEKPDESTTAMPIVTTAPNYGGFDSQVKYGEHLITICGCNHCHTPKKMGPRGPELDSTLLLSGHPSAMPPADVDRKLMESKGNVVTNTLTAWIGPWGISYAGNLTSDESGIGAWQESNFITSMREGKLKGLATGRTLLPPMPWEDFARMKDDELKAIFAYLKATKPIHNIVPPAAPPAMAEMKK